MATFLLAGLACFLLPASVAAQTEIIVTGRRGGVPAYERPYGALVLGPELLATAPQRRLDEALRAVPGFGLFRRAGSTLANPTTQGVSLRGIGPNGAGRTLVLVDGVPVNDPFGGWVAWSRLPTDAVERVVITRGGGAGPWGNTALAGSIRIETATTDGATAELSGGSQATLQARGTLGGPVGGTAVPVRAQLAAGHFRTDGAATVRGDRRGPIDIAASARSWQADGAVSAGLGGRVSATARLSGFREHRGNGTPYTENESEAVEASLRLVGRGAVPWEAVAYSRDWRYASTFSAVNGERTAETPSLDQFDVPARAHGGLVQVALTPAAGHSTDIGLDLRRVEGATNELFFFQSGDFRRQRRVGGRQTVAGLFAEHVWEPSAAVTVSAGARLDRWTNAEGERREFARDGGALFRLDRFPDRSGTVANGRFGFAWTREDGTELRAAAYTGFRLPTLNELYRPFRVGNDIVEANPELGPERLIGVEAGVSAALRPGLTLSATLFRTVLHDGIDNVVIQDRPGLNPRLDVVVPAGGSLAQRLPLDRVRVDGLEAELRWAPADPVTLGLSWLVTDGRVMAAASAPALVGRRPAQAPRHQGTADATWRPDPDMVLRLQVRAASAAFEDGANSRSLAPFVTADLFASWTPVPGVALFATVENLSGRQVETGRRADDLVSVGTGRRLQLGIRLSH